MIMRPAPSALFLLAVVLLLFALAGPIAAMLVSVQPGEVVQAFASPGAQAALRVSLLASLGATAAATLLGVPAGYWLAHASSRIATPMLFILALPLAFPPVASGIVLLSALRELPVADTVLGVTFAEFFVSGSFVAIAASAAFRALDPVSAEAVRTLGIGEWRLFWHVELPAAAPNVTAGIVFTWLRAIGEYGATSIVAYHPTSLPVALYVALSASGVRAALALSYGFVMLAALVLGATWILRRRVVM
jgi:ABC-type sulfate transport system permease component